MTDFVVKVKDIFHDNFFLIWLDEEDIVLGRRVPVGEDVVFESGEDHGKDLRLLIWDEDEKILNEGGFLCVLFKE